MAHDIRKIVQKIATQNIGGFEAPEDFDEIVVKNSYGKEIDVYDDWGDKLFAAFRQFASDPFLIIRAKSWETAYEIMIDEAPAIPDEDIPEAYGFDGWDSYGEKTEETYSPETVQERFDAAIEEMDAGGRPVELMEGYEYKSNFGNTSGIVATEEVGLQEFGPEDAKQMALTVEFVGGDEEDEEY